VHILKTFKFNSNKTPGKEQMKAKVKSKNISYSYSNNFFFFTFKAFFMK